MMSPRVRLLAAALLLAAGCSPTPEYDLVIRNGLVYDGSGSPPVIADVAIVGDSIAAVGEELKCIARREIDATGLAVAPGFINMLSWANESLLHDGRSQSDIRQGVTLEVLGEGFSMGPLNEAMREEMLEQQGAITYPIPWTTLGEYLATLESYGISTNVASFVGAATVRINVLGYDDRAPSEEELAEMQALVEQAMREGAVGVSSSLIYAPAVYAGTDELIALARTAAKYDGMYASHIRSEGNRLLEAVEEFLTVVSQARVRGEIYHLKAAGAANWEKLDSVIARIERARQEGQEVTADMYVYTAGATGMDAMMPPWVLEGGFARWVERLKSPPSARDSCVRSATPTRRGRISTLRLRLPTIFVRSDSKQTRSGSIREKAWLKLPLSGARRPSRRSWILSCRTTAGWRRSIF